MLRFYLDKGGFKNLDINDEKYNFLKALNSYYDINILNKMIDFTNENKINQSEFGTGTGHFIRISSNKVEFGQYDDNFFQDMEQFKDYVDEGEIIFGSIPTNDFLEIVIQWRDFIIKCEEEKNS